MHLAPRQGWCNALGAFVRGTRASAGIELGIGAVGLLAVAALCLDLYARVEADSGAARAAATMADYVSRGPDTDGGKLDGGALKALGKFLLEHELGASADLVFVVSALRQGTGTPTPAVEVLWSDDRLRFGDKDVTAKLAAGCARFVSTDSGTTKAALPAGFTMDAGEVAVVAEVCARLTRAGSITGRFVAGDIYRVHALPAREPGKALLAPVHARLVGSGAAAAGA